MKEMTLREIQLFELDILKDVHEFCMANNIRYSLAYGTLIGAIRHKGFLPWDDDIDIVMPRPDYDRFCCSYKSKAGYEIFAPALDNSYLGYARVCDFKKSFVLSIPWCTQSPTGLWIDIFPMDGLTAEENLRKVYKRLRHFEKQKMRIRLQIEAFSKPIPLYQKFLIMMRNALHGSTNIKKITDKYEKIITADDYEKSSHCGNRSILMDFPRDKHPRSVFEHYETKEFEGLQLMVISEYDACLRAIYGDYMTPPPEEERVQHPQKIYWL